MASDYEASTRSEPVTLPRVKAKRLDRIVIIGLRPSEVIAGGSGLSVL